MPAEKVASSRSAVRNGLVFRINRTPLDSAYSHSVEVWTLEMGFVARLSCVRFFA